MYPWPSSQVTGGAVHGSDHMPSEVVEAGSSPLRFKELVSYISIYQHVHALIISHFVRCLHPNPWLLRAMRRRQLNLLKYMWSFHCNILIFRNSTWIIFVLSSTHIASLPACHVTLQSPPCPWRKTSLLLQPILIKVVEVWVGACTGGSLWRQLNVFREVQVEESAEDWNYEDWTKLQFWNLIEFSHTIRTTAISAGVPIPIGPRDGAIRQAGQIRTSWFKMNLYQIWYHDDLLLDLFPLFQTSSPSAALGPMVCWLWWPGPWLATVGGTLFITSSALIWIFSFICVWILSKFIKCCARMMNGLSKSGTSGRPTVLGIPRTLYHIIFVCAKLDFPLFIFLGVRTKPWRIWTRSLRWRVLRPAG